MELFVARHVCVVLLFKGRRAHEGDDHSVLARRDRRVAVTTGLYLLTLMPALVVDDLGSVFSMSGALGGATLSYMGPGLMYIAVHGGEFLDKVAKRWGRAYVQKYSSMSSSPASSQEKMRSSSLQNSSVRDDLEYHIARSKRYDKKATTSSRKKRKKNIISEICDSISWYILLMPLWCKIAAHGKKKLKEHEEAEALKSPYPYAFGKIIHHKPQYKRYKYTPSPANSEAEGDFVDGRPMTRVGSLPAMLKPMNSYTSLQDLNLNSSSHGPGTSKKKVGFAAQDSLGNELVTNEKESLLAQYRPISASSFSAASFEVMRPGSSGSSPTIFEDDVRVQNNISMQPPNYGSGLQSKKALFEKKNKGRGEDIEKDGKHIGLDLHVGGGGSGSNENNENNIYDNDTDVEFQFSETFESDTGHETDGLISHGSLPGGDEGLLSHDDTEYSNLCLGEGRGRNNNDDDHDRHLTSFDDNHEEEESHTSSVYVEEEVVVDDDMYESDCASDASSVHVGPSPLIQSSASSKRTTMTMTTISTYSKYDHMNFNSNQLILNQIHQNQKQPSVVSVIKASPNSMMKDMNMCEDDPQDDPPTNGDFFIAIFYVLFGFVAAFAGMFSAVHSS